MRIAFSVLQTIILIGMLVPTTLTLVPHQAKKTNRLGYHSYCAFAPYSTVSLVLITVLLLGIISIIRWALVG